MMDDGGFILYLIELFINLKGFSAQNWTVEGTKLQFQLNCSSS
jgi:hypothetical protein